MEQLHLFGEPEAVVERPDSTPLATTGVHELLERWPHLYLGTSSWSFPGWQGLVYRQNYQKEKLASDGLRAYSKIPLFRTVSLDRTYYRPMDARGYAKLRSQVPSDFRFVVKAPRDLLRASSTGIDRPAFQREFLDPLTEGLQDNLGVVLLQFPPGTLAERGPGFVEHLGGFLNGLPREVFFSLELRDEALLGRSLSRVLEGTTAAMCSSVHPSLPSVDQQLLRVAPTPKIPLVFRWNLRPSLNYKEALDHYQPFSEMAVEDRGRRQILVRVIFRALEAGRTVYLTVNNKAEGCAPLSILKFLEELSSE